MLKEERNNLLEIDINKLAHPCDTCHLAACVVYCRADSAYLCAECDATIHSANPLARRHHRVPIGEPILDAGHNHESLFDTMSEEDEDETASWLFLDPVKGNNANESKDGVVFSTLDEYLGLDNQFTDQYSNPPQQFSTYPFKVYGSDSVVPFQSEMKSRTPHQHHNYQFGSENGTSKDGYYNPASISHSVSVSSMDTGIVPESTTSDVSVSNPRSSKGTIDLFASPPVQIPTQLSPMDREARVLRYREKKKMRKFEKTIRYASRKAYAETRPRIKGRFAKRTDVEDEVDQMFATSVFAEGGYGIVPSY